MFLEKSLRFQYQKFIYPPNPLVTVYGLGIANNLKLFLLMDFVCGVGIRDRQQGTKIDGDKEEASNAKERRACM